VRMWAVELKRVTLCRSCKSLTTTNKEENCDNCGEKKEYC
jgi:RNA polymerase subunit RPABC4/transcription elongation factor Spt4